jgi:malonate-semialdehyde dehydrogenase (acetylating)/methylmalonate-semialdehyde dehydrogenase
MTSTEPISPQIDAPVTGVLPNYIGGAWTPAATPETLESRDPATGSVVAHVPVSGADAVDAAVIAATSALPTWRATSPLVRARALLALRSGLVANREELARAITRDMGKTLADADAEVGRAIEAVEAAASVPHLIKGETLEQVASGVDVHSYRQPVGVVAAITPFNFPVMIPLMFLSFAVACGNTVILKPSEQDPTPTHLIFELINGLAEFPPGVVNLVHGSRAAVDALLAHPGIHAVSFVGSSATAQVVAARAAASGKRCQALGGAKNSIVIMPDADRQTMVDGVLGSAFGAAGQRCLAGSVAVLVGSDRQQDDALDALLVGARKLRTGPGVDPATDVCPLVSPASRRRLESEIERAVADGARLVLDGRSDGATVGTELAPTILDDVPSDSRAAREELFGPVLSVVRVPDLQAAIDWTNRGRYGNAAVIFTTSGSAAREFRFGVEAGMLGVNVGVAAPIAWFPLGGWKASIVGDLHANGTDIVDFYTRKKVVTERWR